MRGFPGVRLCTLIVLLILRATAAASPQAQTTWQLSAPTGRSPIGTVALHLNQNIPVRPLRDQVGPELRGKCGQMILVRVGEDEVTLVPVFLGDPFQFFLEVHDLTAGVE